MKMYRGMETQLHTLTSALDGCDTMTIKNYSPINFLKKLSSAGGVGGGGVVVQNDHKNGGEECITNFKPYC